MPSKADRASGFVPSKARLAVFAGPAGAAHRPALPHKPRCQGLRRISKTEAEEVGHSGVLPFGVDGFILFLCGMLGAQRREVAHRQQARQRPHRHGAHQVGWIAKQPFRFLGERPVAGIADGDQHVADKAVTARTLDGRGRKKAAESPVVEAGELGELGRDKIFVCREVRLMSGLRELVPGADRQAIVASKDAVADGFTEFAMRYAPCARW